MNPRKFANSNVQSLSVLEEFSENYLRLYWPEFPESATVWADNAVLMLSYQEAALALTQYFGGRAVTTLDISTGPALAPLLAMINCVAEIQLSDFNASNRQALQQMPIDYWRNYVPLLVKLYQRPELRVEEILSRLDRLRSARIPVAVDLLRESPFGPEIRPHEYELICMNFVADSISDSETEYLRCLGRVTDMVRPGGGLFMSAVVDSTGWQLGSNVEPSPNVSEETVLGFLKSQGFKILSLSRSIRHSGMSYTGGWVVVSAARTD